MNLKKMMLIGLIGLGMMSGASSTMAQSIDDEAEDDGAYYEYVPPPHPVWEREEVTVTRRVIERHYSADDDE